MTKQEISEIKRLFTPTNCSITRICGCYVDGEKNKKAELNQAFLSLAEEDMFKYFDLLRRLLSGRVGRNLLTLEFPLEAEKEGSAHEALLELKASKLKEDSLLEAFYDHIIEAYEYTGNYLILLIHDVYDVPGRTSDGLTMDDASADVYEYLLAGIFPVNLSKPGLSYHAAENTFGNRIRDWIVGPPETGFLFPAFHDRGADLHSILYYSKNPEELKDSFAAHMFGVTLPLSASGQKETFHALIERTLGETCNLETVKSIHEKLSELAEEHQEEPQPLPLRKEEVKSLLAASGAADEKLAEFDRCYEEIAGENASLLVDNVISRKSFDVKTPDVSIHVNPQRPDLIRTQTVNGKKCLVIELDGTVEVNGITCQ
ncbi:MAG: DUF4317 domain-containing protein [Clostridium sp.]|jgi:hypothetical protein|nr:DUF4317 domain-containing protein [Clostridium sp.]